MLNHSLTSMSSEKSKNICMGARARVCVCDQGK